MAFKDKITQVFSFGSSKMMLRMIIFTITLFGECLVNAVAETGVSCHSPAYLEYGQNDVVHCKFSPNFDSVFWYMDSEQGPFVSYENGLMVGPGYDSGKFRIIEDGSLLVTNVNVDDEKPLRVFVHYEGWEDDVRQRIEIVVFIRPTTPFPYIDVCEGRNNCLIELEDSAEIKCSVNKTRPDISLVWYKQDGERVYTLPSQEKKYAVGHETSSTISTKVSLKDNHHFLKVITCQTSDTVPRLNHSQSTLLIEKKEANIHGNLLREIFGKPMNNFTLDVDDGVYAGVWKRYKPTGRYETIGYIVNGVSHLFVTPFNITKEGALEMKNFQIEDEGQYLCLYATAKYHASRKFRVYYFIEPSPPYPKVFGCVDHHDCQLNVSSRGHLTCSLEGIRPLVHLEWIFIGEDISPIIFSSPVLFVARKGDSYDSSVTTSFEIQPGSIGQNIQVACRVADYLGEGFKLLQSNIRLHYVHAPMEKGNQKFYRAGLAFLIIGPLFIFCCMLCCCMKCCTWILSEDET